MKKIKYILILIIILLITGCNSSILDKIVNSVDNFYDGQYNIKYINSYNKGDITYVTLSADDTTFYVKSQYNPDGAGGLGDTSIETSLLSSFYIKNRNKIESIAQKYNLNIVFNEYNNEEIFYFDNHTIEIDAKIGDIYNIKKFCEEVIEIEDINKIYNLVYGDGSYSYYELEMIGLSNSLIRIYNNGSIIKSFTIFEEKFKDETSKINIY